MCEATLIMATIGALGSGASAIGANKQAQAQMDAAAASNAQQQAALQLQQVQVNEAASEEARQRAAQTNRELGKFMVASGASGLSGISLERQQAATNIGEQLDLGVLATNRENRIAQSQLQALGVQAQAQSRINQAEASSVGPLGAVLGIAQGAAQGYVAGAQLQSALDARKGAPTGAASTRAGTLGDINKRIKARG
jgi:hypothetical protein